MTSAWQIVGRFPLVLVTVHSGYHAMPVTGDDWSVELSPDERLAVYNYCTEKLKSEGKMADVEKDDVLTTDWERIVKKGVWCCFVFGYFLLTKNVDRFLE